MYRKIKNWFDDKCFLIYLCYLCSCGTFRRWMQGYPFMGALDGGFRDTKQYADKAEAVLRIRIKRYEHSTARSKAKIEYYDKIVKELKQRTARRIDKLKKRQEYYKED